MEAFSQGRLAIRQDLHLGVGLLAATSGDTEPGRLRFHRVETADHEIAISEAGEGPPLICIHGLGGTKASFMPTIELARAARPPRDRDRPAGLRRLRQAASLAATTPSGTPMWSSA